MAYAQGSVVLIEDPYKDGFRPMLIVSNDERPYQGKQYTVAVITSTERTEAVPIGPNDITEGDIKSYPSYVNPWSVHEFEHVDINRRVAQVSDEIIRSVALGIHQFVQHR